MKKVFLALASSLNIVSVHAEMTRCGNNPGINNQNAINSYKVTRWAYNCPSSAQYMMSNVQKIVLGIHYNSGKEKMKDFTILLDSFFFLCYDILEQEGGFYAENFRCFCFFFIGFLWNPLSKE